MQIPSKWPLTLNQQQAIADVCAPGHVPGLLDLTVKAQRVFFGILEEAEQTDPNNHRSLVEFRRYSIGLIRQVMPTDPTD